MHIRLSRTRSALALALACGGCSGGTVGAPSPAATLHTGGQTGGEAGIRCSSDVTVTPLAFDAVSPLGFSAADVAAVLPPKIARPLAWTDGTSAVLDVALTFTTGAGYAAACRSNVASVSGSFESSDGALAEVLEGRLFSAQVDRATLDVSIARDALVGTLVTTHPTLAASASDVSLVVDFDGSTASGRVLATDAEGDSEIAAF